MHLLGPAGVAVRRATSALSVLALLAASLSIVVLGAAAPATAAPAGSEYPATWTLSGNVATGTTASGTVVTATITGPAVFATPVTGPLVPNGTKPAYMPTTDALRVSISGCSVAPCGSIRYSYSRPVKTPVLYTADVGSQLGATPVTEFHNHPVTLTSGTFSLDSAGSQSANMSIQNSGKTIGITDPAAPVGQTGGSSSCGNFGCGAYAITTATPTVTAVTVNFGYAGTGVSGDTFTQLLGATPLTADLGIAKSATGSTPLGGPISWSAVVTNNGPDNVPSFTVTDPTPAGVTGVTTSTAGCVVGAGAVTCTEGALASGSTFTIALSGTAPSTGTSVTNTATVATTTAVDSVPGNDSSSAITALTGSPLSCDGSTIYAARRGNTGTSATNGYVFALRTNTIGSAEVSATLVTAIPNGGMPNGLAITKGGTAMYAVAQDTGVPVTIYGYSAASQAWTSYTGSATAGDNFVGGAVNPANGIYYYVAYTNGTATTPGTARIYGFDTATNTPIAGVIGTTTLAFNGNAAGDVAFDSLGNMYLLQGSTATTTVVISKIAASALSTSGAGTALTSTTLSTFTNANSSTFAGVAFDNSGAMYVQFGPAGAGTIQTLNPNTGAVIAGPTPVSATASGGVSAQSYLLSDLAACSVNPTLTVQKNIAGRFAPTDQFGLSVTGGGIAEGNTATTTGSTTGLQSATVAGPVIAVSGTTYTVAETAASGNLANYTTTYSCVDTANGNASVASGTGRSFSLPFPAASAPPQNVVCTFTNTPVTTGITIQKSVAETALTVGETLHYSFLVTNTGSVPLAPVTVAETGFSGTGTAPAVTCPAGAASLAPGAQVVCAATYVVTQDDVDAGTVTNTATASGTTPAGQPITSSPSSAQVPGTPAPAITVVKTANPATVGGAGKTVAYSFSVTNTGNVTLANVTVDETAFTGTGPAPVITCPAGAASLSPGEWMTCTAAYVATQADVDAGSISNTATATGTPPTGPPTVSPPSTATVTVTPTPAITVVKSASPSDAASFTVGQDITYSFVVTNTGNVTLANVTVDETAFTGAGAAPAITCPAGAASLAPGAQVTCTATYTLTQADVDAGSVTNGATATGTPPTGPPSVSPPSTVTIPGDQAPALTVVKSASPSTVGAAGDTVTYSFRVTNTGNVTLTGVAVDEGTFSGTGPLSAPVCPAGALLPGAQVTCTATYTLTQADVDAGSVTNTATATGTPPTGPPPVSPPSTTTVTVTPAPALTIVKSAAPVTVGAVGDTVTYSFLITNTGNVTLADVGPDEGAFTGTGTLSAPSCPPGAASLAPGVQVTCAATYTLTQGDVDAGSVTNTATATGTPPYGPTPVSPPSTTTITATPDPALSVVKTANPATVTAAGQTVTYSFVVTNTGNVTLHAVGITEGAFSGTGTTPAAACPSTTLAPGAFQTCTAAYTVTQADLNAGTITNTATAHGTPPGSATPIDSPPDSATVTAPPTPAITIVKSASPDSPGSFTVGRTITYSFVLTNTGNVTLANATVAEGTFTGTGTLSAPVCPAGAASLAPGAQVTCTATYTVTQADVDAGSIANTATATGTPPTGPPPVSPPSSVTVPEPPAPALTVVKSANATAATKVGQKLSYSFLVTNTGNVTLTDATVTEGTFTGTGTLSAPVCPAGAASLAPGAQVTCTATYTVTQADLDAGSITNTATATGTPPTGAPPVSPPSTATVPSTATGKLGAVKSAHPVDVNGNDVIDVGDRIDWTVAVTNLGNATVTGIAVSDPTAGAVTCPARSLAPGESMTCTAPPHTVTAADVARGKVANTAFATGSHGGIPTSSGPATTAVNLRETAAPLPVTGVAHARELLYGALGLLLLGGLTLLVAARRRSRPTA